MDFRSRKQNQVDSVAVRILTPSQSRTRRETGQDRPESQDSPTSRLSASVPGYFGELGLAFLSPLQGRGGGVGRNKGWVLSLIHI